jgi:hypothetical protein
MLFQNGMVAFRCSQTMPMRDPWQVEMVRQLPLVQVDGTGQFLRLPVAVHANYCNIKSKELDIRGLWLYHEGNATVASAAPSVVDTVSRRLSPVEMGVGCKAYNASNTYFAFKNWTAEIADIEARRDGVLRTVLVNGTLLKRYDGQEVYLVVLKQHAAAAAANSSVSGTQGGKLPVQSTGPVRRLVPDSDTFAHLGYEWSLVRSVPTAVLNRIPEGAPLPSTSTSPTKAVKARRTFPLFERLRF